VNELAGAVAAFEKTLTTVPEPHPETEHNFTLNSQVAPPVVRVVSTPIKTLIARFAVNEFAGI
jgi:hypothetical protein